MTEITTKTKNKKVLVERIKPTRYHKSKGP